MEADQVQQYPVRVTVDVPTRFSRIQVLVRVLVFITVGKLHQADVGLFGLLYFALPAVAAILVAHRGGSGYLARDSAWLVSSLEWVVGFYAYMLFVTDVFPLGATERAVQLRVSVGGTPSVGRALLRLLTSLPHLVVLVFVGLASVVIGVLAAVSISLFERYPEPLRAYQQGVAGWVARLFAYHASLVGKYPPLSFPMDAGSTPSSADGGFSAPMTEGA